MSKTADTYEIRRDGDTKTFDDESAWKDMQQLLDEQDVAYEAVAPDNDGDTDDDGDTTEQSTDGGTDVTDGFDADADVVDHSESQQVGIDSDDVTAEEPASEQGPDHDSDDSDDTDQADSTDTDTPTQVAQPVPDDPPERNLSDDPVEWFGDIGEFTYEKQGTTCINKKGLRVLQYWYDIDNPDSEVVVGPEETDHTFCRVRAEAKMPDGRRAVAHGSAHVDRGDDAYLLTEMADTRAKSRLILDITGMGAVAVSELENEL